MLLVRSLLLLLGSSLILIGCKHDGPKVTVCLLDPYYQTLECSDPEGNESSRLIVDSENFVCMSPDDFQTVLTFMKERCGK